MPWSKEPDTTVDPASTSVTTDSESEIMNCPHACLQGLSAQYISAGSQIILVNYVTANANGGRRLDPALMRCMAAQGSDHSSGGQFHP